MGAGRRGDDVRADFQYIRNLGFNQDRGPVRFWGVRLHLQ